MRNWWNRQLWQSDRDCIVVGTILIVAGVLMALLQPL